MELDACRGELLFSVACFGDNTYMPVADTMSSDGKMMDLAERTRKDFYRCLLATLLGTLTYTYIHTYAIWGYPRGDLSLWISLLARG